MRRLVALLLAFLLAAPAHAGVRRFALLVGNDEGPPSWPPLLFAEDDARKMQDVLVSVGGYAPGDVRLVLGRGREAVVKALAAFQGEVALARREGDETLFLFYYSGHADARGLMLGSSRLGWDELDRLIEATGADVRLAFLDACESGAMTRRKGGQRAPSFVFHLDERLGASGEVVITSSAVDEASQESDEIGGGYFTYALTSALVGAADADRDERITLGELYRYVYEETVFRTSTTRSGVQHPSYSWELTGKGDVVLADLSAARAALRFSSQLRGTYALFDVNRRAFVAELGLDGSPRELFLRPGTYLVQRRLPSHLEVARVDLEDGTTTLLGPGDFRAVEYEDDLARGAIERRVARARMPRLGVQAYFGVRRFTDDELEESYFPHTPAAGAALKWWWRDGRWLGLDLLSGGQDSSLGFEELDYRVPVVVSSLTVALSAGYATRPATARAGAGLLLSGAYFRRDFPGTDLPAQDLFSLCPGWSAWLGLHPWRLSLDIELRNTYLPVRLGDRPAGASFAELYLAAGYRF